MDIGKSVMKEVVLHLPVVGISCQKIDSVSHKFVNPWPGRVGAMITVVHYVHANSSHPQSC